MKLIEFFRLTEGASPVLYHYTTVTNLEPILQNNEFSMATSYGTGAETPHDVKGAPYYLSTTRHKLGAYHSTGANYSVMLVLDGAALAQNYKIKPVDYWDAGPERSESEDRVFSREQTIPNASKYIKEIHMITEDPDRSSFSSDVVRRMTRKVLINAKKLGVPIYLYRDSKAWLLQDKRKALPISQALDQPEEKAGKRYSSMRTNWFKPWIELYHKRTAEELSPEAARLLRNLRYDDYNGEVTRRLLNTVHNDKRSPNVVALIKLMQQNRLSTVAEYTALLKKKWGLAEDVDFEKIRQIQKQPKFPWGAQIGQTATTQANTYDIGRPGTVIKKIRIEHEGESIVEFFKLIMQHQDNPFFPRIYNAKMYQNPKAGGLTLIVEMEKLRELTDKMLVDTSTHILNQMGFEVTREMFDKTWNLALQVAGKLDTPAGRDELKKMSKNPKFVEALDLIEGGLARHGSDLHHQNMMLRLTQHGPQLVLIDPFQPGAGRFKDDDRE